MTYEQNLLNGWVKEYSIIREVRFMGYDSRMCKNYDAICYYPTTTDARYRIYLTTKFNGKSFAIKCGLWHEMAHAIAYDKEKVSGHGWPWLKCYLAKPWYVLGMFIVAFYVKL